MDSRYRRNLLEKPLYLPILLISQVFVLEVFRGGGKWIFHLMIGTPVVTAGVDWLGRMRTCLIWHVSSEVVYKPHQLYNTNSILRKRLGVRGLTLNTCVFTICVHNFDIRFEETNKQHVGCWFDFDTQAIRPRLVSHLWTRRNSHNFHELFKNKMQ